MFYGPKNGVQLSYGINQGDYYTHDPKFLSYGPTVFSHFGSQMSGYGGP
jgi:hypothetical protein